MTPVLRGYQRETNERKLPEALRSSSESVRRVLLVSPCGSGKTTMFADLCRRAAEKGKRALAVAPRRKLVRQAAERLAEFGVAFGVLMADLPDDADFHPWAVHDPYARVQVASRDTLYSRANRDGVPQADLVVLDEAHLYSDRFDAIEDATGCSVVIGPTATPCRPDGSGLSASKWHTIVEATTIEELLALNPPCLVPVDVYAPVGVAAKRRRGLKVKCSGDPVRQWLDHAEGLKTVTFCRTTAESRAVRDAFGANGIRAEHIDAHTPDEERESVIARLLAGELDIITNVDVVGLGVDIPQLDCVQLLTKCVSPVRLWQCVGRCQRPAPGKTRGVLLDHAAATAEHGMPNVSPAWCLDERDSVQNRTQNRMEANPSLRPVTCSQCGLVSAGSATCPACSSRLFVPKSDPAATGREPLTLYVGDEVPKDRRQSSWERYLYMAAAKGWDCARAAAMFKSQYGIWPQKAGVQPLYDFGSLHIPVADVFPQFVRRKRTAT